MEIQEPVQLGLDGCGVGLCVTEWSMALTAGHMVLGVTDIRLGGGRTARFQTPTGRFTAIA